MYKFIDLFAGIGGIRLAFERQGCECVFTSEWDKKAQETYEANFGDKPHGDITQILSSQVPDHDILLAGFPCQPFSVAGVSKKNSLGRKHGFEDETQGTLFFDLARIIRDKRPKAFLLENVKNLKSHDKGRTYRTIMRVLQKELGYWTYSEVLDAKGLVPQHRERIYIVGFREPIHFEFPELPKQGPSIKEILQPDVEDKYTLTDNLWRYLQDYAEKHRQEGNGFGYGLVDLNSHSRTLSARYYKDGSEILIPQEGKNPRRLTPRECARLQGFPDDFVIKVADTAAYKQFGNSVSVPVVEKIAEQMMKALGENKKVTGFHRGEVNLLSDRDEAIFRARQFGKFYCKVLSPNDIIYTGAHRTGLHVSNAAGALLFDEPGAIGENKDRTVRIYWEQLNVRTDSMFKWLGKGKRSEYRITKLGKGFPYLTEEYVGDLFVLIQANDTDYLGYVLSGTDAELFLEAFSLSSVTTCATYGLPTTSHHNQGSSDVVEGMIGEYVSTVHKMPLPEKIAEKARDIYFASIEKEQASFDPSEIDKMLLRWIDIEYGIFKQVHGRIDLGHKQTAQSTDRIETIIMAARASHKSWKRHLNQSFQSHLEFIFSQLGLPFSCSTDDKGESRIAFEMGHSDDVTILECRALCKVHSKQQELPAEKQQRGPRFLATVETSLGVNQLAEMKSEGTTLVVPQELHEFYPVEYQSTLLTMEQFCQTLRDRENKEPLAVFAGQGE